MLPLIAFTPYFLLAALASIAVCALLRQWSAAVLAGVAVLALLLAVAPRALGGPDEEVDGQELRVMTANVLRGSGDPEALVELVRDHDLDLLAVQELTPGYAADLERLGIREQLPHVALATGSGVFGSGIYSRFPVPRRAGPGELDFKQMRAIVAIAPRLALDVASAHPVPPSGRHSASAWREGFAALPNAEEPGPPHLVIGDFNATLDHERLRELIDTGYADAGDRMGEGLKTTWPADRVWPPEITIDHILFERDWGILDYEVLELPGSDHRPVYAELVIPGR